MFWKCARIGERLSIWVSIGVGLQMDTALDTPRDLDYLVLRPSGRLILLLSAATRRHTACLEFWNADRRKFLISNRPAAPEQQTTHQPIVNRPNKRNNGGRNQRDPKEAPTSIPHFCSRRVHHEVSRLVNDSYWSPCRCLLMINLGKPKWQLSSVGASPC